jgi:hypothetical protein
MCLVEMSAAPHGVQGATNTISSIGADVITGIVTRKKGWSWNHRYLVLYLNSYRRRW